MSCIHIAVSSSCEIRSHTETEHGRNIEVTCEDDMKYFLNLYDVEGVSTLDVSGEKGEEKFNFLKIEHQVNSNNLYLTLQDKTFSVKDENSAEESAKLEELLTNPNFSSFSTAVQEVHDKLKLPGWKSPSTMFLYRIGMSIHHNSPSLKREETESLQLEYETVDDEEESVSLQREETESLQREETVDEEEELESLQLEYETVDEEEESVSLQRRSTRRKKKIDRSIYDYHGEKSKKECKYNGRKFRDIQRFIELECLGMCGQSCKSCWKWVCGDCCTHRGCWRHDRFCTAKDGSAAYSRRACTSFRGVLWDTVTDTRRDC